MQLAKLGGSWYFLLAGLALVFSGVQIARVRPSGAIVYGVMFIATVAWALADAGFDFWAQVSRLLVFAGFGVLVALAVLP